MSRGLGVEKIGCEEGKKASPVCGPCSESFFLTCVCVRGGVVIVVVSGVGASIGEVLNPLLYSTSPWRSVCHTGVHNQAGTVSTTFCCNL